jgi:hypothetical protein
LAVIAGVRFCQPPLAFGCGEQHSERLDRLDGPVAL